MEKYVIIENFDNYAISNYGNIKNIKTGRQLTPCKNKNGYLTYTFCQNQIKKTFRLHRLVGLYFIPNPNNLPYINHKDGNKTNNYVDNLEWCTAQENNIHARAMKLIDQEKPILAINISTKEKISFKSISEASAFLGINKGTIHKVLSHKRNQTHGFSFQYL